MDVIGIITLVVLGVTAYAAAGGLVAGLIARITGDSNWCGMWGPQTVMGGFFWPLALPFMLGWFVFQFVKPTRDA